MSGRLTEAELLRTARQGLSPNADEESRVWMRVGAALLSPPPLPPSPEAYGPSSAAVGHAGMSAVKLAAIALGVGATLGFGAGYLVGIQRAPRPAVVSEVVQTQIRPAEAVATPPDPAPAPTASAVPEPASEIVRRPADHTPAKAQRPRQPRHHEAPSLAEEVETLARSRRALGSGNPQLALGLLAELDQSHPNGALRQEREATRILALCGANRIPEGPLAAERFISETPSSIYAARIREACGLPVVTESEKAGH